MGYKVKGGSTFWNTLDAANDPDIVEDIYEVCFALLEKGPALPFARPARWPIGQVLLPGWSVDVGGGRGFIGYITPETLGKDYIYLAKLVIYDWDEE